MSYINYILANKEMWDLQVKYNEMLVSRIKKIQSKVRLLDRKIYNLYRKIENHDQRGIYKK